MVKKKRVVKKDNYKKINTKLIIVIIFLVILAIFLFVTFSLRGTDDEGLKSFGPSITNTIIEKIFDIFGGKQPPLPPDEISDIIEVIDDKCTSDIDCLPNRLCQQGVCVIVECKIGYYNGDCPKGSECVPVIVTKKVDGNIIEKQKRYLCVSKTINS